MSPELTACEQCKYYRQWLLGHYCVVHEKDVFDPLKGCMEKESDRLGHVQSPRVSCLCKNKGDCPDFEVATVKEEL